VASRGKARGWRERRFSRRDALCASALREAPRMPRHCVPAGCVHDRPSTKTPLNQNGMLGLSPIARCFPLRACGARPSRRGDPKRGGLAGEGPGMARKAVFSEGRTLCVRVARPRECRGIPFAADGLTMSRWPRGHMPRSSQCLPIRACGARPSAERRSKARWPRGGRPGDDAKGGFLGGTHSVRPHCMAKRVPRNSKPGDFHGMAGQYLSRRAEPAPPGGGPRPVASRGPRG
jgi:hypothetical protein